MDRSTKEVIAIVILWIVICESCNIGTITLAGEGLKILILGISEPERVLRGVLALVLTAVTLMVLKKLPK